MSKALKENLSLMLTGTLCLLVLWVGGIWGWRQIIDKNYHTPSIQSGIQSAQQTAYKDCLRNASPDKLAKCKDALK